MIYEHGREPDVSAPRELVGTTVFTAVMIFLIIAVL